MSSTKKSIPVNKVFNAAQESGLDTFNSSDVKQVLEENSPRITSQLDEIADNYGPIEKIAEYPGIYTKRNYQHDVDQLSDVYERKALDELVQSIKHGGSLLEKEARNFIGEFLTDFETNGIQRKSGNILSELENLPFIEKDYVQKSEGVFGNTTTAVYRKKDYKEEM